jgi:polyhydroxybutyrate depolymerase
MRRGIRLVGACGACGLALVAASACGSSSVADGHWASGAGSPVDGGASLASAWPKGDPDPGAAPTGAPTFGGGGAGAPVPARVTCSGKAGLAGDQQLTLTSSGGTRDLRLHVPAGYDPTAGQMLVLSFHGFSSNAWEQEILTRMDTVADAHGFLVAYPDGVSASWNAGACCGVAWNDSVDDVQFTKDMLALIASEYCIDPARIYATGMSNGGFMSHRLGCEMADTFAAIAPVAGVLGIDAAACNPSRPVPILDFHGTADPIVPYKGGTPVSPVDLGSAVPITFRSVADSMSIWRTKEGCSGTPDTIYAQGDATCQRSTCSAGSEVVLCTIDQGGHTWPGGVPIPLGKTSIDISATETMVEFFEAHPMPVARVPQ